MTIGNIVERNAVIVGGGIAGLTAAVALRRVGLTVEVIEINDSWTTGGWGLSLTGPALRALDSLGLADRCIDDGFGVSEIRNRDAAGELLNTIPLPPLLGAGRPAQAGLGRPALQRILRDAAVAAGAVLSNGLTVIDIADDGRKTSATISDGTRRDADVLVVADGVHSRTRRLLGYDVEPRYTQQMVWRALVDRPEWATALETFAGAHRNVGVIPISSRQAYTFVTTQNDLSPAPLPDAILAEEMRSLLEEFTGPIADVRDAIVDPGAVVRRPVHVSLIDGRWNVGRSVVIGDAAHSPSPQMVSGAALAIEDGVVLAEELAHAADVETALASFGRRRLDRCRGLVEDSVRIGELEKRGRYAEVHAIQQGRHRKMAEPV